jgi:hypothetical protein
MDAGGGRDVRTPVEFWATAWPDEAAGLRSWIKKEALARGIPTGEVVRLALALGLERLDAEGREGPRD